MNMPSIGREKSRASLVLRLQSGNLRPRQQAYRRHRTCPFVVPARCQRVEVRDAVLIEHNYFAVDREISLAKLEHAVDDQWELLRPIPINRTRSRPRMSSSDSHRTWRLVRRASLLGVRVFPLPLQNQNIQDDSNDPELAIRARTREAREKSK
jgi:hypothetical protein